MIVASDQDRQSPPAVSVILPVYNRASTVLRAVQSVVGQTFTDWELIVVDDGSTDGSLQTVRSVGDPRLKIIGLPENKGGNFARNRGLEAARGELIAFLDSDDHFLPHKLETEVAVFRARPEFDLILGGFVTEYPAGRSRTNTERAHPAIDDTEQFLDALFRRILRKATPGIVVRKAAAVRAGGFDEQLKRRQDYDFLLRVARFGRCASIRDVLWVKSYPDDAISRNHRSTIPTLVDFHRRHPAHHDHQAYRDGLSLDVARHLSRLAKRGMWSAAASDAAALVREFGLRRFAAMLKQGLPQHRALLAQRKLERPSRP